MRAEVVLSADAERDVDDIVRYISENDGYSHAARVLDGIEQACFGLVGYPNRGNIPKELVALGIREYRQVYFKPYRIIYRVMQRRDVIYCVLDGRRDMQTLLQTRLLR
jgi:toxin ParE1/3/4